MILARVMLLLDRIADVQVGPGDPVDFDPEEFIKERLGWLRIPDEDFERDSLADR